MSTVVSLSTCNGIFICYLMSGSLRHKDPGGQVQPLTGAQGSWPTTWCTSGPRAAGFLLWPSQYCNCVSNGGGEVGPDVSLEPEQTTGPPCQPTAAGQAPRSAASTRGCAWQLDWGWCRGLPHQATHRHTSASPGQGGSHHVLPRDAMEQWLPDPNPLFAYAQAPGRDSEWQNSLNRDRKGKTNRSQETRGQERGQLKNPSWKGGRRWDHAWTQAWRQTHAPLSHEISLTKHKFKDKIIQNFSDDYRALNPQHRALLSEGPCVTALVTCPWRWSCFTQHQPVPAT